MLLFVGGIVFAIFVLPVLQDFTDMVGCWIKVRTVNYSKKIETVNQEISQLNSPKTMTHAIGFAPWEEEVVYEDDDEDDT